MLFAFLRLSENSNYIYILVTNLKIDTESYKNYRITTNKILLSGFGASLTFALGGEDAFGIGFFGVCFFCGVPFEPHSS